MKKRLCALALVLALLSSCAAPVEESDEPAPEGYQSAPEVAQAILDSQPDGGDYIAVEGEDRDLRLEVYGLPEGDWLEAAVYVSSGVDARELAVIRLADESDGAGAAAALEDYRKARRADFYGYVPQQAELVESGAVWLAGRWAVLAICTDMTAAWEAFDVGEAPYIPVAPVSTPTPTPSPTPTPTPTPSPTPTPPPESPPTPAVPMPTPVPTVGPAAAPALPVPASAPTASPTPEPTPTPSAEPQTVNPGLDISGFAPFDPPNDHDMTVCDTSAIRTAWTTGEEGGLSERDAAVLEKCKEIFSACVTEGMTHVEKELALHDWLVANGEYDFSDEARGDPYGMLVEGSGICLGYATTFQLFMDLAGVECITVVGASSGSMEDHAWNMVKLEGEWYCVDVTWDDSLAVGPDGRHYGFDPYRDLRTTHRYFNVTSDYMRQTDHQWDYLNVPEATATRFRWDGRGEMPE